MPKVKINFKQIKKPTKTTEKETIEMEPNLYVLCIYCGETHHEDDEHQCKGEKQ